MKQQLALAALLTASLHACTDSNSPVTPECSTPGECEQDEEDQEFDDEKADTARNAQSAQMNDLTIIYPLPTKPTQLTTMLSPVSQGRSGKPLLPQEPFATLFPNVNNGGVGADNQLQLDTLRMVAVRFDPCFAELGPIATANCDNQIRLIFQSLTVVEGTGSAVDGAVHAFYRVTRDELKALLKDVIALRRAQGQTAAMGALAKHPLLVKQGVDGAFAKALQAKLLERISAENLIQFTFFTPASTATAWNFSIFKKNGQAFEAVAIPASNNAQNITAFAGFSEELDGAITPQPEIRGVDLLISASAARAASRAEQQLAYNTALAIENPTLHSPNTVDCASCHTAEASRVLVGESILGLSSRGNPNLFVANKKFVSTRSLGHPTKPMPLRNNFHMMSYRFDDLMIQQRVINETAALLPFVNGTLLKN